MYASFSSLCASQSCVAVLGGCQFHQVVGCVSSIHTGSDVTASVVMLRSGMALL